MEAHLKLQPPRPVLQVTLSKKDLKYTTCLLRALHQSLPSRSNCCASGMTASLVPPCKGRVDSSSAEADLQRAQNLEGKAKMWVNSSAAWGFAEVFAFCNLAVSHPSFWLCWEYPFIQSDLKPASPHWNPRKLRIKCAQVWPSKNYLHAEQQNL